MLRIATRGSALARWQAAEVSRLLRATHPGLEVELVVVDTSGDLRTDVPIAALGGQGAFVKEVQAAVLDGRADAAVHSAKDLPSAATPGLEIVAVPRRGDPRDALVGTPLADLGPGALVATGSVRRQAQLAWLRPDLTFTGLRGNIATRLAKCPPGGAVVVAAAALARLELAVEADVLPTALLLPQVGQGALAVEIRAGGAAGDLLGAIDDPPSHRSLRAERGFLAELGSGCDLPVGAYAQVDEAGRVTIEGLLARPDGSVLLRERATGDVADDPAALGTGLARTLLAQGGAGLWEAGR